MTISTFKLETSIKTTVARFIKYSRNHAHFDIALVSKLQIPRHFIQLLCVRALGAYSHYANDVAKRLFNRTKWGGTYLNLSSRNSRFSFATVQTNDCLLGRLKREVLLRPQSVDEIKHRSGEFLDGG